MAERRDLSLATIFTANISSFQAGIKAVRAQMNALNADMARGAARAAKPMTALGKVQATYAKRVGEMAKVNDTYKSALDGVIKSTDGTARSQANAIKYMDRMHSMVNKQAVALTAAGKNGKKFAQEVDYVNLVAKDQAGLLRRTAQGFEVLSQAAKKAGKAQSFIGKQIAQVEGAMSRLGAAMKVTAAYGVAASAIYMVVDALKGGVDEIVAYDQALKNLQAITGATDAEIRVMGETIKQVARNTKFSMTETADAMVLLGQAGFDAGESIDAIEASAMLATGTLSDMRTVTDLMTTAVRAFALEASQAGQISDIMANAVNKSKLTIDKLRIAMNYVGPAAYAVGAELEEVAASMMVLANSGLRASTIGTGLRQVFSRLVAPSAKLREAFEEHSIELEDLNVQTHGFTGVLRNLGEVFVDAKTGAIDAQKAFELFGLRGANSILALMRGINSGEFQTALDHVYEVGTAANMAGIQIEGLALQFKNLTDRFKSLMVELGNRGFVDVLQGFLEVLRQTVIALTAFVEKGMGGSLTVYTTFITTTGLATVAVLALGKAIVWVTKRFAVFAYTMLSHPIGIMIFAVGALAAAYKRFQSQLQKNLHAYQSEVILGQKRIDVLISYQKRLKKAHEAAQKDQSQMKKYTSLVQRLKTEFRDLAGRVDGAGDNFEELHQILKEEAFNTWFNTVSASIDALAEQSKVHESTKATAGWWERVKNYIGDVRSNYEGMTAAAVDYKMKTDPVFRAQMTLLKELDKVGDSWIETLSEAASKAHESAKALGEGTEKATESQKAFDAQVIKTSNDILFGYQRGVVTIKEMAEHSMFLMDRYDALSDHMKIFADALERAITLAKELEASREKKPITYAAMESPFQKMIAQAKGFRQVELLNIKRQMDQEISAYKDKAKKEGIIVEEAEKNKAAIRMKYLMKAFDVIDKENDLEAVRYEKKMSYAEEFKNKYIDYFDAMIAEEQTALEANREIFEKGTTDRIKIEKDAADAINGFQLARVGVIQGVEQEITDITRKSVAARLELNVTNKARDVERTEAEYIAEINKRAAARTYSERTAATEVLKVRKAAAFDLLQLENHRLEEVKKNYAETTVEYASALDDQQAAYIAYLATVSELEADANDNFLYAFKERFALADEYYKEGKINAEEYNNWLALAREEEMITEEEMNQRKIAMTGTYFEALKQGFVNAKRELQTFGEMWMDLATDLPRQFADGMLDAFDEVIDGSKSFGEAMADFFAGLLEWIAKTIMQLLIMKALMAAMDMIGMGGGATSSLGSLGGQSGSGGGGFSIADSFGGGASGDYGLGGYSLPHTGGVIGKDQFPKRRASSMLFAGAQRFHEGMMGLKRGEVPVIVKKDEGIFTPAQMKMLGGDRKQVTVNVPVNVSGDDKLLASKLRSNIEAVVLKTLRQEMR